MRKYVPKHVELKWKSRYPKRQYSRLEQLQLDVKGRIYVGKQKLYRSIDLATERIGKIEEMFKTLKDTMEKIQPKNIG